MSTVMYYAIDLAAIALFIAAPFLAVRYPWTLMVTIPLILAWGTWALNRYWRWVRALGTNSEKAERMK
jgi:hypothetical protein